MTKARWEPHDHTDRLCLRAPVADDRAAVATLHTDPATNLHNPRGAPTQDDASKILDTWIESWADMGIGYWCVRWRDAPATAPVIGAGGVRPTADGRLNLYYRFDPRVWGLGLASELASHAVRAAGEQLGAPTVIALVRPENRASIAVARKAGLVITGRRTDEWGPQLELSRRFSAGIGDLSLGEAPGRA